MIKNWMLWVAIAITILVAGYVIANLPVRAERGEGPVRAIGRHPALGMRSGNVGRGTPLVASGGHFNAAKRLSSSATRSSVNFRFRSRISGAWQVDPRSSRTCR